MPVLALDCLGCGRAHEPKDVPYTCPSCGANLQARYDTRALRSQLSRRKLAESREWSLWRYLPLLPVKSPPAGGPSTGWTPLYEAPRLARALGLRRVWVKDDGRNPSASFKDRASAVVAARALEAGERVLAAASTGNAASSLACLAAGSGAKVVIFVPRSAPAPKVAQLLVFGATVLAVDGSYDEAFDLCAEACQEFGWYNRSTGYNPYTREGKKTCAFELCEQLGFEPPDWVFVPAGDGNILSGLWKGFLEFRALGLIDRLPRLAAAQAAGSDSIARAVEGDGRPPPVAARTIADSISVSLPRDGVAAVRAVRDSGGMAVRVSDREILAAMRELATGANVFAEPAAAAAYAALRRASESGRVAARERVVVLVTGSGLKDVESARKAAGSPRVIEPSLAAVRALKRRGVV